MRPFVRSLVVLLAASVWGAALAGAVLDPQEAPDWEISEWINADPGPLGGQKGRVVVVHFFQMWCPGCNNVSIPLMHRWEQRWGARDDFMIVSVHSVFEGHTFQTADRLRAFVRDKGIRHPVGIDAYADDDPLIPVTMKRFKAGGSPHIAIVDKEGRLVFSHFGVSHPGPIEFYVERLLKEETEFKPPPKPTRFDMTLSGTYQLEFEQTSKTCGPLLAPRETPVRLEVYKDRIDLDFPYKFMGLTAMSVNYDPRWLRFEASLQHEVSVRGKRIRAQAKIDGSFVRGSRPPALDYKVLFTSSGTPEWTCKIEARGRAVRTAD